MQRFWQVITSNVKPLVRNDKLQGRDWIVVPVVLMVEGVLNGNRGPIFYPRDEMATVPVIWNHKPCVVYHPVNGSACTPEELESRGIGMMMNIHYDNDGAKLKGEAWLDPDRIAKVDPRIAEAIENEQMLELSTGLYMDVEEQVGEFNGKTYIGIARNFRPDHLAILPDKVGACSCEDGAGFIRLNQQFVMNELSYEDMRMQARSAVSTDDDPAYIMDMFSDSFVFEKGERLFRQGYSVTDDKLSLVGVPVEVVRVQTYEPITNDQKGTDMKKEEIVQKLIDNDQTKFTKDDKESLMGLNQEALEQMAAGIKKEPLVPDKPEDVQNAAEEGVKDVMPSEPKKLSMNEYIEQAPPELRGMLRHGVATYNEKQATLIAEIVANENNDFTEEYLKTKDVKELEAIAKLARNSRKADDDGDHRFVDFSGQAPVSNADDVEPLPVRAEGW